MPAATSSGADGRTYTRWVSGIGAAEPPDQRLFVGRHENLSERRALRRLGEQDRQRAARVGIEVLERFVDPEEVEPRGGPQDEDPQDELRDHLLAVAELLVVEFLGADAAADRPVAFEPDARAVDEQVAPVVGEQVLERLDALVQDSISCRFERGRRRLERRDPLERVGHRF